MSGSQGGYSQSGGPQSFNGGLDSSGRSAAAYGGGMAPANTFKPPSAGPAAWGGPSNYSNQPPQKSWMQDERMQPQQSGSTNVYNPSNPLLGSFGPSEMPQRFNAASEMPTKMATAPAAGGGGYAPTGGMGSFGPRNMSAAVDPAQAAQGMGAYGLPQWLQQRFAPQQPEQGGGGQGYSMNYPSGGIPGWQPPPPITTPPGNGGGGITPPNTPPPTNNQGIAGAYAQALGAGNTTGIQQLLKGGTSQDAINRGFMDQAYNNTAGSNASAMDEYRKSIGYKGPVQTW